MFNSEELVLVLFTPVFELTRPPTAQMLFLRRVMQFLVPNNLPSHSEFRRLLGRAFSF